MQKGEAVSQPSYCPVPLGVCLTEAEVLSAGRRMQLGHCPDPRVFNHFQDGSESDQAKQQGNLRRLAYGWQGLHFSAE